MLWIEKHVCSAAAGYTGMLYVPGRTFMYIMVFRLRNHFLGGSSLCGADKPFPARDNVVQGFYASHSILVKLNLGVIIQAAPTAGDGHPNTRCQIPTTPTKGAAHKNRTGEIPSCTYSTLSHIDPNDKQNRCVWCAAASRIAR